jgi:hypothetical protein
MNQSTLLFIILAIFIVVGWYYLNRRPNENKAAEPEQEKTVYHYRRNERMMTPSEAEFYQILTEIIDGRYYLFPQVHLSSILDHRVKGDGYINWNAAFKHINGKSVDYVLCDKVTFAPVIAIELDDPSHDQNDRRLRDDEVERIFKEAELPLVRFAQYRSLERSVIEDRLRQAVLGHIEYA